MYFSDPRLGRPILSGILVGLAASPLLGVSWWLVQRASGHSLAALLVSVFAMFVEVTCILRFARRKQRWNSEQVSEAVAACAVAAGVSLAVLFFYVASGLP
jgi:hypothetical protein